MRPASYLALWATFLLSHAAHAGPLRRLPPTQTPFDFLAAGDAVVADTRLLEASRHLIDIGNYEDNSRAPWRLLGTRPSGWTVNGWVSQGTTSNKDNPTNPAAGTGNLPVGYNYRSNEYQLNQLYLFVEKSADTGRGGWSLGCRVDLLFGEDYFFVQSTGLETDDLGRDLPGANRWNRRTGGGGPGGAARNGLALPQAYGEVAHGNVNVKVGHFYSGMAYEDARSPRNFFYSRSYNFQYGLPVTLTGALGEWRYGEQLSFVGGLHNGWDVFDGSSDQIGFMGGATWCDCNEQTLLRLLAVTGKEPLAAGGIPPTPVGRGTQTALSLILSRRIGSRWQYVFEHVSAWQDRGSSEAAGVGTADAAWYSFNQYLFYTLSECWRLGVRYEWFAAEDGTPVANLGGPYRAATLGLNFTPTENITIRPEVRWDRFDPRGPAPAGPFINGTRRSQFLAALDVLLVF